MSFRPFTLPITVSTSIANRTHQMPPASSPVMVRCDIHPGQLSCPCPSSIPASRTSSTPGSHPPTHPTTVLSTTPPNGPAHVPAPGSGLLAYPRPALPGLPGGIPPPNGAPGDSVYSSPYAAVAAAAAAQAYGPLAADPAALYSGLGPGYELKESAEAIRALAANPYYNAAYEGGLPGYPYGYGPMDLDVNARRKTATRENTNTLKAWLYEHRKNPYPTKGEKIMLAIITRMTLTQVSTWFANARRRLKKDNKMTWTERGNGQEGDSDADVDDDDDDKDGVLDVTGDDDLSDQEGMIRDHDRLIDDQERLLSDRDRLTVNEWAGDRLLGPEAASERLGSRCSPSPRPYSPPPHGGDNYHPHIQRHQRSPSSSPIRQTISPSTSQTSPGSLDRSLDRERIRDQEPMNNNNKSSNSSPTKPKIWSLADVATSTSSSSPPPSSSVPSTTAIPAQVYSAGQAHPGFPAIYGALRPWFNGAGLPVGVNHPLAAHPGYLMSAAAVAKGLSPASVPGLPAQYAAMMPHGLPGYRVDALALSRAAMAAGMTSTSPSQSSRDGSPPKPSFSSPNHNSTSDSLRRPGSPLGRPHHGMVLADRYQRERHDVAPYTAFKPVTKKVATL